MLHVTHVIAQAWHELVSYLTHLSRWQTFWLLNLELAVGASWLANGLWNAAVRRLPLTLSGQMIVFETLFGLLYGFVYDHRWPRLLETTAIVLLVAGVLWPVLRHAGGINEKQFIAQGDGIQNAGVEKHGH